VNVPKELLKKCFKQHALYIWEKPEYVKTEGKEVQEIFYI
jgi:hypothetical protein